MANRDELEAMDDMLTELEQLAGLGWLDGEGKDERLAVLFWKRGDLLNEQKKYQLALKALLESKSRIPQNFNSLKQKVCESLNKVANASGSRDGKSIKSEIALTAYEHSLQLISNQPYVRHDFALQLDLMGKYNEALQNYLERHKIADPSAISWTNIGYVYLALSHGGDALNSFSKAIELNSDYAYPWAGMGTSFRVQGQYEDAIIAYNKAIEIDPEFASPWNGIGNIYISLGKMDKALYAHQKAVELSPERGMYRASLVGILRRLRRDAEAIEHEKIARSLIDTEDSYNIACFESICGNSEEALRLLKIAIEQKQITLEWAKQDPDFDFMRDDARFKELVGLK